MKWAAEGARLPASERSPAIVRLPFMFVMLSTISVNRRGPLSMPRAELGIDGLKAGAAIGLEKVREMKKVVSGRPASAWGQVIARTGPPDTTFFISALRPRFCAPVSPRTANRARLRARLASLAAEATGSAKLAVGSTREGEVRSEAT